MEEEKVRRKIIGETWLNEVEQLTKWYEDLRKEYKRKFGHHQFSQIFPLQELPQKFDAFLEDLAIDCGIAKEFETLKYVIFNPGKSIFGITSALGGPTYSTVKRDIDTLVNRFFLVRIDTNFARKARFIYPDPFLVKARARAYAGLERVPIPMIKRIDVSFLWMEREGRVLLEKEKISLILQITVDGGLYLAANFMAKIPKLLPMKC